MFTLKLFEKAASIPGQQTKLIVESYLLSLCKKLEESYPKRRFSFDDPEYPQKDIDWPYVDHTDKTSRDKDSTERYQRYNPFNLRLPFNLHGYSKMYADLNTPPK